MLGLMMDTPLLITDIMRFAAANHADTHVVSITSDRGAHRRTYREVFERTAQLAHALRATGVQPGDRIGTLAWNDHRHLELYFAVSCIGAVIHTINPRLFPEQVEFIVNDAADRLLFVDPTLLPLLAKLQGRLPAIERVIALTSDEALPADVRGRMSAYEGFIAGQAATYPWPEFDERTASGLCYTSGTTGKPKGVLYSHRSTVLHAYAGCMPDVLGLSGRDSVLAVVPMFHANAWGLPYNAPMTGARLVLPGPKMADPATLTDLIESEGVTMAAGVPTVWTGLLAYLEQSGRRIPSLKRTIVGGSAVPLKMIREFAENHGVTVLQGWGMTEMSPLGTVNCIKPSLESLPAEELYQLRTKQGRAVFGVQMKIVDAANRELPWDGKATGELKVRGWWICKEYFGANKSTGHDAEGWFATGDVASIDPDGYLQITDRAKDVIKSGGEWISSVDLENCACAHPDVLMAAAIGVRHPKWEERPLLLVVARQGRSPARDSVLAHLGQHFAKWQLPDDVVVVDAIPLTATGKINKVALRERYGAHLLQQASG